VETIDKYTRLFANIHYHPPVKPDELFSYTASADVGLCVLEKMVPSHFFTCPTKIFEYLNCGLPIIVSNCLPAKKIIQDYNCGWEVACEDEAVDSLIISITRDIIDAKRKNSLNAREYFGWEFEKPVLINVYRKLGF
jgi:glycosyltransferase involved in cell wall biosynthesis